MASTRLSAKKAGESGLTVKHRAGNVLHKNWHANRHKQMKRESRQRAKEESPPKSTNSINKNGLDNSANPLNISRLRTRRDSKPEYVAGLEKSLGQYFKDLKDARPVPLHPMIMGAIEETLILYVLERSNWHIGKTASLLGISRNTLSRKIKSYKCSNAT